MSFCVQWEAGKGGNQGSDVIGFEFWLKDVEQIGRWPEK